MNYHDKEWIMERLQEHWKDVLIYYPEDQIIGIFYYGAANYGVDTENSDVDTVCLLAPKLDDIASLSEVQSEIITRKNNELIFLYDIRDYFKSLKELKDLVRHWGSLFTEYFIINNKYQKLWEQVLSHREELINYSEWNFYKYIEVECAAMRRQIFDFPKPNRTYIIAKYGYDPKKLHYLVQYQIILENKLAGKPFREALSEKYAPRLLEIKLGTLDKKEARELCKQTYKEIVARIPKVIEKENPEADKLMNELSIEFLREELRDDQ